MSLYGYPFNTTPWLNSLSKDKYFKDQNITLMEGNTREVLKACDYGVISSGTATLEAMLSNTPFCVIYKSNSISNFIISNILLRAANLWCL